MVGDEDGPAQAKTPDAAQAAPGQPAARPASEPPPKRRRRGWRALAWCLAALGAYALLGFVVAPRVAQSQLLERLPEALGRPVSIGRIEFNPFTLLLRVHDLSVSEPGGGSEFAGFTLLEADVSWRSAYRLAPVVSSVSLKQPRLRLARDAQGRYNVEDLVDRWAARPSEPGPTPRFSVANIVVDDGRLEFDDRQVGVRHEVAPLALRVPFVSSLPVDERVYVEPSLHASVNGAPFELDGRSLPFSPSRDSTLDIDLDGVDLTRFAGYSPVALPVELRSGRLDAALKIVFSQPPGAAASIAVTGTAGLAALELRQPGGAPLLAVESIAADQVAIAWPEHRYTVARIAIAAPDVTVERRRGQARYLEPVLAALERGRAKGAGAARPPAAAAAPTPSPQWRIDEVVLTGGKLAVGDERFQPKPLQVGATAIEATVRRLDGDPNVPAEFGLSFELATGERAQADGTLRWRDGAVDAKARLSQLALAKWWWIVEPQVALDAAGGVLDLEARVRVAPVAGSGASIRIEEGAAHLEALSLRQRWDKRTLLTLPQLDVEGVTVDLAQREVDVGALTAKGGQLLVRRDDEARFNLQRVVPAAAAEPPVRGARREASRAPGRAATAGGPGWSVSLGRLAVAGLRVDVEDQRSGKAANLRVHEIGLDASGLSTVDRAPPARVALRARVDRRGALSLTGQAGLSPLTGNLRVVARDLVIVPLQPYFSDYVNALVSSGAVSADGTLRFAVPAQGAPRVSYRGRAAVGDFAAVSKEGSTELLRWKTLAFDAIEFDSEPLKAEVGEIALGDFYARMIVSEEGRLNLRDLLADRPGAQQANGQAQGQPEAQPPARGQGEAGAGADVPARPKLRIGGVRLANGNVDFTDLFVRPNYSANLTGMNGQVSQITPEQAGDVELRGRVDGTGSVEILGKLNPLADQLLLDLKASASDIDLPRLSPYSGKYVGYGIEKGKLSMKVAYKVENRELSAENNIVLDQLTFGEKVDSPDAVKLPVLFAVSLLKDRNGVIDVNLPISGSLDDPQFSVGGIVLRIIVNLIVKAVTAPFALIANLAGAGGAELSWIGFEPGSAALGPSATGKLETLARALTDRPGLKLDMSGRADPAADREALRRLALERAVKAQKLRETVSGGVDVAAIDQVKIEPQEYEKYLTLAWRAAKFEKPRNAIGLVKTQPRAEMERMLLAHIEAGDDELTRLANDRAQRVKDWLVGTGGIPGDRLFIVAPRIEGDAGPGAAGDRDPAAPAAAPPTAPAAAPAAGQPAGPAAAPARARVDLTLK